MRLALAVVSLAWLSACGGEKPIEPPGGDPCADADADGVCDAEDACPGADDRADGDGDGVPDGCDPCPLDAPDDTDGDGVCDADDPCPLDAPDDTDGDGVCDADDPCPLDAPDDTDGDGVCDTDDPCPLDDPDDTDGDGVCDTDDVCPDGDDALDTDGDGVPDACDPCPLDDPDDTDGDGVCDTDDPCPLDDPDDTDGDGICDSDDACPAGNDALDADGDGVPDACDACPTDAPDDSDGDGVCDSLDVCPGTDDDLDADADGLPDGCACAAVDVAVPVGNPTEPLNFGGRVSFSVSGIYSATGIEDYVLDGVPHSAVARLTFFDAGAESCSIWWDVSAPGAAVPGQGDWMARSPVGLFAAWELTLQDGQTDCNDPVAELILTNMENASPIGVGVGPMLDLATTLRQDPAIDAAWATEWEPYVASFYFDGAALNLGQTLKESAYVFQYDRTCQTVKLDPHTFEPVRLPKPVAGPLLEYVEAVPVPI